MLRFAVWIVLIIALAMFLWSLSRIFPGSISTSIDQASLVRAIIILVVVSAALVFSPKVKARVLARNVALWTVAMSIVAVGYAYREELTSIGNRVRSELVPSYAVTIAPHTLSIAASENGSFYTTGIVNGVPVLFLIDTGASDIVLSPADAKRVGLNMSALDFSHQFETAHGIGYGAMTEVAHLSVGPIQLAEVAVSVNQSPMSTSLLGLAFLRSLDSFRVSGDHLFLQWRGPQPLSRRINSGP